MPTQETIDKPQVTKTSMLSMQVCVPSSFSDDQVTEFANAENLAGTQNGWTIRREGDKALMGRPERVPCDERCGCVHIMLDC